MTFQLPAVMRLRKYIRPYFRVKDRPSRAQIFRRDGQICQYCHRQFSLKELTLDHIIPLSKGGGHTWDNVVTSCSRCNNKKGNKTPEQVGLRLLRKPFKPDFLEDRGLKSTSEAVPESWLPYLPNLKSLTG